MQTLFVFILVLSLLVFIHELGHFLFAKRAGILVREFAIGFGPKIFSRMWGETVYSIRALPLGGFVRMAGDDAEVIDIKTGTRTFVHFNEKGSIDHLYLYEPNRLHEELSTGKVRSTDLEKKLRIVLEDLQGKEQEYPLDPQAIIHYTENTYVQIAPMDRLFGSKTVGQRALTIFAGPLFNIVLTILLFSIYTGMTGIEDRLPVEKVLPDSPAAEAGIKAGDWITAVGSDKVNTMDVLRYRLSESKGAPVIITIQRGLDTLQFQVTPKKAEDLYQIGVQFNQDQLSRSATLVEAVTDGVKKTYEWTLITLDGFTKLITGQLSIYSLGGPVQMGEITGRAAQAGFESLVKWTAFLSLNLGIFNLLPIPALDGSRLLFIGLETLRGRPVHPNKESFVHFIGFALLMMLMLVVTFNDIKKIFFTS
jgi:regulator of sigma E protease